MLKYACVCFLVSLVASDKVIETTTGSLRGFTVVSGGVTIEAFLGVPYAEPPVGPLRFGRPVPKSPWEGVYEADSLPPSCIQNGTEEFYFVPVLGNMTEDCLHLNMWVPYSESGAPKPVILYLHGGSFNHGSSNMPAFDGTRLSSLGDVVIVTANYRVGAMGFFAAPACGVGGNMGLYDVVVAAQWVRDNARAFGGDPDHVVLFGESAGAMAAGALITSNVSRHLFKRVIMDSGSSLSIMSLDDGKVLGKSSENLARFTGCANKTFTLQENAEQVVACLMELPAKRIADAEGMLLTSSPLTFFPRVDGDIFSTAPVDLMRAGDFKDTELLIGLNADEGTSMLWFIAPQFFGVYGHDNVQTVGKSFAKRILNFIFKQSSVANHSAITEYYLNLVTNASSAAYTNTMSLSLGDYVIVCNTYYFAEYYSVRNPVYFFVNQRRPSVTPLAEWVGVTHFDELPYVFGNPIFGNWTEEEYVFSDRLMKRWLAFAKTGNPNVPGELEWPRFTHSSPLYLKLDDEEHVGTRPDEQRCEFWRDRHRAALDDLVVRAMTRSSGSTRATPAFLVALLVSAAVSIESSYHYRQ